MNLKRWLSLLAVIAIVCTFVACGGKKDEKADDNGIGKTQINAVGFGVDNTGKTDMTEKITELHEKGAELGKTIYYPNGTYLFNGATLNFESGVEFESIDGVLIRNSISDTNIINFDDAGNLIGLMHNHLEQKFDTKNPDAFVTSGNLVSPPLSTAEYETVVEFLPYWYNDFGLYRNRYFEENGQWHGWYDWRWNHHDIGLTCQAKLPVEDGSEETVVCGAELPATEDPYEHAVCPKCGTQSTADRYDATRHPLLGWYRGDTPEVLDWQCYWLQEYGMKQAILINSGWDESTWNDPAMGTYWVYNLLNNTPNAKTMKFATQVASTSYSMNEATVREKWWALFNQYHFNEKYKDMVYCYEVDGKRYALLNLWDERAIRFGLGQNVETVKSIYKDVAQAFKDNGYDGVCITAREGIFGSDANAVARAELKAADVLWFGSDYPSNAINSSKKTYAERTEVFFELSDTSRIYGVATGMHTHNAHPSNWNCPGNTPELFGRWLKNAVEATVNHPERPQMVTCYNIAEWAEGGPGLTPTVGDRFGYLEAIRDNIVKKG